MQDSATGEGEARTPVTSHREGRLDVAPQALAWVLRMSSSARHRPISGGPTVVGFRPTAPLRRVEAPDQNQRELQAVVVDRPSADEETKCVARLRKIGGSRE